MICCPCSSIRNQDHSGSSFGEAFVEQVLEGSLDPKFATSVIFLGCIILSSSFSTAMTHLQVEVRIVQNKMSSICLLVKLRTCKQLWAPICYCSQDLDRWCPPPPSAAPRPPCSPPRQQNINRAYNVNAASADVATLTLAALSLYIFCLLPGALCIRELFVQLAVQRFRLKFRQK